jgi:hypothetical protein
MQRDILWTEVQNHDGPSLHVVTVPMYQLLYRDDQ